MTAYASFVLFVVLVLAPASQYSLLFVEMTRWHVAVGRDVVPGTEDAPIPESHYVDENRWRTWFLGLQDADVRRFHEETGKVIYVHAAGRFEGEGVRANLGDGVFIPWQARIYLLLLAASLLATVYTILRLSRYRGEFEAGVSRPLAARAGQDAPGAA